jgi:hypothetical protein
MPYKDPQKKKDWELKHRSERRTRRQELRRVDAAPNTTTKTIPNTAPPKPPRVGHNGAAFLLPFIVGGAIASQSPKLAMGTGGLTLLIAALFRKGPGWWIAGIVLLALGLFFYAVEEGATTVQANKRIGKEHFCRVGL